MARTRVLSRAGLELWEDVALGVRGGLWNQDSQESKEHGGSPRETPTQPEEHSIPTRQMSQVSTHQVTSHPELTPYKGPEDPQQPVPGEPPQSGLTVRGELLQGAQAACVVALRTLAMGTLPHTSPSAQGP